MAELLPRVGLVGGDDQWETGDPGDPSHAAALAPHSDLAALLIRIELRLAEYPRTRAGFREAD